MAQLAAAAAFVQSLTPSGRGRAFGLAQSGLLAVQGLDDEYGTLEQIRGIERREVGGAAADEEVVGM